MKKVYLIVCAVLIIGTGAVIGCTTGGGDGTVATTADPTEACMTCHDGDTPNGQRLLAASAGYLSSGHYLGQRVLDPLVDITGHKYIHTGSLANTYHGYSCAVCHTHQAFIDSLTGSAGDYNDASPIGCFTCHAPHDFSDFSLTTTSAVTLKEGTSYKAGKGALCVKCHMSRDTVITEGWNDPADFPKSIRGSGGPHYGPQGEMLAGVNNAAFDASVLTGGAQTYTPPAADGHYSGDTCVKCHMDRQGSASGSNELSGHGMYLMGDVHGSHRETVSPCKTCHTEVVDDKDDSDPANDVKEFKNRDFADTMGSGGSEGPTTSKKATADWDGDLTTEHDLDEIDGLKDKLIAFFGTGANFGGAAGDGLIVSATTTGVDISGGEWTMDWDFASSVVVSDEVVAQAFWNFKFFLEDRSTGVHNPMFAAQILYDSIDALNNATSSAGIVIGTRPAP